MQQESSFFNRLNSMGWVAHIFYAITVYLCVDFVISGVQIVFGGDNPWWIIPGLLIFVFFGLVLIILGNEWIKFIRTQIRERSRRS